MSNSVLINPVGLKFDNTKAPNFMTLIQESVSGKENRLGLRQYPKWVFSLSYEILRDTVAFNELETLGGFFLQMRGQLDSFLYSDPQDNAVVDQNFGTGNGSTTQFQLSRAWGGFNEPVQNVNAITNIKKAGVAVTLGSGYTISSTGLVTFATAPAAGNALTWTGTFYYRCRFTQDASEYNQFMQNLWELKQLSFIGSTMNKV